MFDNLFNKISLLVLMISFVSFLEVNNWFVCIFNSSLLFSVNCVSISSVIPEISFSMLLFDVVNVLI